MSKSKTDQQLDLMLADVKENPALDRELLMRLHNADHTVQMKFIENYEQGYCARFVIPAKDVIDTVGLFPSLTVDNVADSIVHDWGAPPNARMHNDVYYNILSFYLYYAVKTDNRNLGIISLNLLLYKIWNGRLYKLIKWCNPEIMAAGIAKYLDNRSIAKKFQTPLDAIQKHFSPTIYDKYKPYLLKNSKDTKRVFEQCYTRIRQIFGNSRKIDLKTGETRYQTGLQPSYYEAHRTQNKIVSNRGSNTSDSDLDERFVSSELDSHIDNTVTLIVLSNQSKYDDEFIDFVVDHIKGLKPATVPKLLSKIHQPKFHDTLRDIVELFFKRIRGTSKQDICSDSLFELTRTKIISSKNTQDVNYIKEILDDLIDDILTNETTPPRPGYMNLTENQKSQYRAIMLYGIAYNIQRAICHS